MRHKRKKDKTKELIQPPDSELVRHESEGKDPDPGCRLLFFFFTSRVASACKSISLHVKIASFLSWGGKENCIDVWWIGLVNVWGAGTQRDDVLMG